MLTLAICIRDEVPSCMRAPPERHCVKNGRCKLFDPQTLLFTKQIKVYLNTDGQIQLYSELKCTSDLFTLSAAKGTAEEGEVVSYPHQFLGHGCLTTSRGDVNDDTLHLDGSQDLSFGNGIIQLILNIKTSHFFSVAESRNRSETSHTWYPLPPNLNSKKSLEQTSSNCSVRLMVCAILLVILFLVSNKNAA